MKLKLRWPSSRGWLFAAVTGVAALALPYVLDAHVDHGFWDHVPGWWAWYGGLGCAVIVVVSKALGKAWLQKPEDFYGESDDAS
ncbi:hypothetical protein GF314_01750 [bacterium]|nr:hypothetical protein [bacterium]